MTDIPVPEASHSQTPAPWIVGKAMFPFGLVVGFMITALPFLLTIWGRRFMKWLP